MHVNTNRLLQVTVPDELLQSVRYMALVERTSLAALVRKVLTELCESWSHPETGSGIPAEITQPRSARHA